MTSQFSRYWETQHNNVPDCIHNFNDIDTREEAQSFLSFYTEQRQRTRTKIYEDLETAQRKSRRFPDKQNLIYQFEVFQLEEAIAWSVFSSLLNEGSLCIIRYARQLGKELKQFYLEELPLIDLFISQVLPFVKIGKDDDVYFKFDKLMKFRFHKQEKIILSNMIKREQENGIVDADPYLATTTILFNELCQETSIGDTTALLIKVDDETIEELQKAPAKVVSAMKRFLSSQTEQQHQENKMMLHNHDVNQRYKDDEIRQLKRHQFPTQLQPDYEKETSDEYISRIRNEFSPSAEQEVMTHEEAEWQVRMRSSLRPASKQQQIFTLIVFIGLTREEVAEKLGIKRETVDSYFHDAKENILKRLPDTRTMRGVRTLFDSY